MPLENIVGDLRAYRKLKRGTFQHVDQLQSERQEKPELRKFYFYTADGNGYFPREDGGVDWAITREADNLVLRHLDDLEDSSYEQLFRNRDYRPDNAEAAAVRAAKDTVVVDMSKLRLYEDDQEFSYVQIRTKDGFILTDEGYQAPNKEEQKALSRLGFTSETLKILGDSEQRIVETRVFLLNPYYVRKNVGREHNSLWRASLLYNFSSSSILYASDRFISNHVRLRGVLLDIVPEIGDKKP